MNIVCVICRDLLTPTDEIFHTPCGHIFHFVCLMQWLERSKTCPQCRERTNEHKIYRLYFNFSNDNNVEDPTSLQNRIDNMTFQIKLKDKNLSNLTEANTKLEKQTAGLRQEIRKIESEMSGKNSAIHAFKDQIKFYQQQCSDVANYRKENDHLKKNLDHLKSVQSLIDGSMRELDENIKTTSDVSKLLTYVAVLRNEVNQLTIKRRKDWDKYKSLHKEHMRVTAEKKSFMEECSKRKNLEERLLICESEKIFLQAQLLNMQADADVSNKSMEKQSLKAYEEHEGHEEHEEDNTNNIKISVVTNKQESKILPLKKDDDGCIIIDLDSTNDSPQIKPLSFLLTRDHGIKRQKSNNSLKVPSILAKKSRLTEPNKKIDSGRGTSFDGFGGHAKYDKFPNPIPSSHIKKVKEDFRIKKSKLDASRTHSRNAHRPFSTLRSPRVANRFRPVRARPCPPATVSIRSLRET